MTVPFKAVGCVNFDDACTGLIATVGTARHPFLLRRCSVMDWGHFRFATQLQRRKVARSK